MSDPDLRQAAEDVLFREALYLDERRWDEWLALYAEDAVFWVPAWKDESEVTGDPEAEISLIYMPSRDRLEERVARVKGGRSIASKVMPRTAHAVSNVIAETNGSPETMTVHSVCTTQLFDPKRRHAHQSFARYRHELVREGGKWLIKAKKILILNDDLPTMLDYYTV